MDIYNKKNLNELSKNKRASYQNIFEIKNIIQNFNDKFNFDLSKNNPIIESYTNKKINLYSVNNNLNNILFNNNKKSQNINQIRVYKSKRISSSYFEKIKNIYASKYPTLLSERIIKTNKKKINNKSNEIKDSKKIFNHNYYLPKISNNRKGLIYHIMNKKLNLISLENLNSHSLRNKNDLLSNKIRLPRVKSTIIYNNNKDSNKRIIIRNKKMMRCNSSINKPNRSNISNNGVKSIYMSFGLTPQKKLNLNYFNKIVLLKNHKNLFKKRINNEENKMNTNDSGSKKLNYYLINDFKIINKDKVKKTIKEKGKEYKFNQKFKKVIINNINNDTDKMLLNDKGTLIGSFFN